jgi:hypothetical protein
VLIGSKRKELGKIDDDAVLEVAEDIDEGAVAEGDDAGLLTREEMAAVMIDLRP